MVQKPLFDEEDIIAIDTANIRKYFYVMQTEDLIYDYRSFSSVAASTLGSYSQMTQLEPNRVEEPEVALYQVRAGIDVGQAYVEILAGSSRRGTYNLPKPTSSNYYVGYFNDITSPSENPTFEFYLTYNHVPSFAVYNPYNKAITPKLLFQGRKLRMVKIAESGPGNRMIVSQNSLPYLPYPTEVVNGWVKQLEQGTKKHRTISLLGLEPRR